MICSECKEDKKDFAIINYFTNNKLDGVLVVCRECHGKICQELGSGLSANNLKKETLQ